MALEAAAAAAAASTATATAAAAQRLGRGGAQGEWVAVARAQSRGGGDARRGSAPRQGAWVWGGAGAAPRPWAGRRLPRYRRCCWPRPQRARPQMQMTCSLGGADRVWRNCMWQTVRMYPRRGCIHPDVNLQACIRNTQKDTLMQAVQASRTRYNDQRAACPAPSACPRQYGCAHNEAASLPEPWHASWEK